MDNVVANVAAMTCCGFIMIIALLIAAAINNYLFKHIVGAPPLTAEDIYRAMITKDGIEP